VHDQESKKFGDLHLPVRIEFVDSEEKVASILPMLCDLVTDGLIEMHETTIVKTTALRKEGSS
jgi:PII-like signaling protein